VADFSGLYERLKKEKTQTLERLKQLKAGQVPGERREGSPFGKREEEATEFFELEKRLTQEKRLEDTVGEIDHALEKYEAGTYGLCDSCGQPIEVARLEALPQASLCLSCKERHAKNAKGAR